MPLCSQCQLIPIFTLRITMTYFTCKTANQTTDIFMTILTLPYKVQMPWHGHSAFGASRAVTPLHPCGRSKQPPWHGGSLLPFPGTIALMAHSDGLRSRQVMIHDRPPPITGSKEMMWMLIQTTLALYLPMQVKCETCKAPSHQP